MSKIASAGMRGEGIRSDCWVQVEEAAGQPEIRLTSKVAVLYGKVVRQQVAETLAALEASDLTVTLEDSGALSFTIAARLEAAVRRLRPATTACVLPPINPAAQSSPTKDRLRRSRLYLPGNTPKFFINAGLHHPDAVILDLEDAVPGNEKDAARLLVRNALRTVNFYGAERMVRVNALPTGLEDIRLLATHGVDLFVLPKVESAQEIVAVDQLLQELGVDCLLLPILESAKGVLNGWAIASASPRVAALTIGLEDYTADLGAQRTADGRESLWARGQVINAARAAGVQPLTSVFSNLEDDAALLTWAKSERALGFEGAACLHPRQTPLIHRAFAPDAAEVERANRIITAFEQAKQEGLGVIRLDGMMVDAPVVARARQVLQASANL
jgi:citrate lyase subunit beta/citryl-CoA lyase